jgi:muramidase (phage lysozyme)
MLTLLNKVEAGSYKTLYNNAETTSKSFKDVDITSKTLAELYEFTKSGGAYDKYSKEIRKSVKKATPLGKYQIVGQTLKDAATALGLPDDTMFTPEIQDKMFIYLLQQRLTKGGTLAEKRTQLRNEWEGLNNVSDTELDEAIKLIES